MEPSDELSAGIPTKTRIGYLEVARASRVAVVTMDRAEKLNAMTAEFWGDLRRVLDLLGADGHTRAVIITGAGEKAFCAGGDIASFTQLKGEADMRAYQVDAMAAFAHIEQSPLMVIAAVNGLALGGGCELALASDMVIAADSATFGLPEASLGLVPGFGVLRAPETIGRQMTKLMIASGLTIPAQRAYEIGLVQMVVPRDELMGHAHALATRIAERSPNALAVGKRMVNSTIDQRAFDYSVQEITMLQASSDRAEGVQAFLARRKPVFGQR